MKIVQDPKPQTGWPIGSRFGCEHCGSIVEIEKGDDVSVKPYSGPETTNGRAVFYQCPSCDKPTIGVPVRGETGSDG